MTATVETSVRVVSDTWHEDESIREVVKAAADILARNPMALARDLALTVQLGGRRSRRPERYAQRSSRAVLSFRLGEFV